MLVPCKRSSKRSRNCFLLQLILLLALVAYAKVHHNHEHEEESSGQHTHTHSHDKHTHDHSEHAHTGDVHSHTHEHHHGHGHHHEHDADVRHAAKTVKHTLRDVKEQHEHEAHADHTHGHGHTHVHGQHDLKHHDAHSHEGHGHGHETHDHHDDHAHAEHGHGHRDGKHGHEHDEHAHGQHDAHDHLHGGHKEYAHHTDTKVDDMTLRARWLGAYGAAAFMSVLSFVGVALMAFFGTPKVEAILEYVCLSFAGATLVADALLHLLPHALEGADHGGMTNAGLAGVLGALLILAVPEVCGGHNHDHNHNHGHAHKHRDVGHDSAGEEQQIQPMGIANLVVEMLHNFVDGISIGVSWMAGKPAGLSATLAVAVHELPQELGDFMVLRAAGFSTPRLLMWNFVASLTCIAGVGVVHYIGQDATLPLQRLLMAFTAGTFLTLSLNMIFPQVMESIKASHSGGGAARAKLLCALVSAIAVFILVKIGDLEDHDHGHGHHDHDHGHHHGHNHDHSQRLEM